MNISKFKEKISLFILRILGHRRENKKQKDKRRRKLAKSCVLSKEQIKLAKDFYKKNYGKSINLKWHKIYTTISGKFDYRYFPELLYTPNYQRLANSPSYWRAISDKNLLPLIISGSKNGVKTPEMIVCASNGIFLNRNNEQITKNQLIDILAETDAFFIKPSVDSNSGKNCMFIKSKIGKDELIKLINRYGKDFIVQKPLTNQSDLKRLNPSSINTFRIITYLINGEIKVSPMILRIGIGDTFLDNAHAGGIFVAVDDNGVIVSNGKTEFGADIIEHPTSKIKFIGYQIANTNRLKEAVKKAAALVPHVGVIDWDVTLDKKGEPVIVEANTYNGSIWLIQMSHGCSVFREDTANVLKMIRNNKTIY